MKNSYWHKILANRGVMAYFSALFVMLIALAIALDFAFDAHANAEATEQKIQNMKKATETYEQKKALLDKMAAKPVTADAVDEVQTSILLQLQRHSLSLSNMNSVTSGESKEKNKMFEMEVSGSFDNTMAFLSSFRKEAKALISVLSVHFNPEKDQLRTTIKYKVYVR